MGSTTKLLNFLLKLFNEIFTSKCFVSGWSKYLIFFISKSSSNKFKPISLSSCFAKILEKIIYNLNWWLEYYSKYVSSQFDFRKNTSCIDNLFIFYTIVKSTFAYSSKLFLYAIKIIPLFNGKNIPVEVYIKACELAKSILPPGSETYVTKIIRIKLIGEARDAVQDQKFTQISQLTSYLKNIVYTVVTNISTTIGELGRIYQRDEELIISYANRLKTNKENILEAYCVSSKIPIDPIPKISLEEELRAAFIKNLKPEIE